MTRIANEMPLKQDEVTIDKILVDDAKNMRKFPISEKETKELAADIMANGQLQPVVVRPSKSDDYQYELVAGFRRFRAIESLVAWGQDMTVLVRVIDAEDLGAAIANISENIKRKDASVIELAHSIGKLKDGEKDGDEVVRPGLSLREIASALGISLGNVSEIERMRGLRPAIQSKIHTGQYTRDFARQLIKMTEAEQDAKIALVESGEATQAEIAQSGKAKSKGKGKRKGKAGKGAGTGGGEGDGNGEGESGGKSTAKRALSVKAALLVLDDLTDVPKAGEGEEAAVPQVENDEVRGILVQFAKFLHGKIGAKSLVNQITKLIG